MYIHKKAHGFTIVELLIVIVVIGILAIISLVIYRGIVNRANNAAVMSDLAQFAKQVEIYYLRNGKYPVGGGVVNSATEDWDGDSDSFSDSSFTFKFSRQAYFPRGDNPNIIYCTGLETASGKDFFRIAARSKSTVSFAYDSAYGSVKEYPGTHPAGTCLGISYPYTIAWGIREDGTWNSWTD